MSDTWERWSEQAHYDLDTAKAMLDSGRWIYVLFCCQQAVEKTLKGLIAEKTNEYPPRIHNLSELAKRAGLVPDEHTANRLQALSTYYIKTRYPHELESIAAQIDQ
ncbi:MAG: HEPN domain-containing protein, partial [bacterium]